MVDFVFRNEKRESLKNISNIFFSRFQFNLIIIKNGGGGNGREIWKKEIDNNKLEGLGEWMNGEQDFFF